MKNKEGKIKIKVISEAISLIFKDLGKLYVLQFFYFIALWQILSPVFSFIIEKLLYYKGYSYLTQEVLDNFFRDPLIVLCMLIMLSIVSICILVMEVYTYYHVRAVYRREQESIIKLLPVVIKKSIHILTKKPISFFIFFVGGIIIHNIFIVSLASRMIPRLKFLAKAIQKIPYSKEAIILFVIFMIFYSLWNNAKISPIIFEKNAMKEMKYKENRHFFRVLGYWILNNICISFITVMAYFISILVAIGIISLLVHHTMKIAVFCTIQEHLYGIVFMAALVLGETFHIVCNVILYIQEKQELTESAQEEEIKELKHIQKRIIASIFAVVLIADIVATYDTIRNGGSVTTNSLGKISITSHRGESAVAPENTLIAVERAIDSTADYIEIDVQETKDGVVVLMHDSSMYRTTGVSKNVYDMTYAQLLELDAGSWFSDDYVGTKIPTLEEVLELSKGKVMLNIEIKASNRTPDLEKNVVALIEEYDFTRQCVVTSMYKDSLKEIKKYNKDIVVGYILSSAYGRYYLDKDINFLSMRSTLVNERVVRLAHKYGKEVHVWTVNTKEEALRMSKLGVDNIITDQPGYIRESLYETEQNRTIFELLKLVLH